jgi:hypothetical protein
MRQSTTASASSPSKQGYQCGGVWLRLDAYWNLHATWFSATTALKNEALSLGVRFSVE